MPTSDLTDKWAPARLIPTVGIRGQEEQEKRATSSLLAVMHAVPEFGHALLKPLGAPKGRISTYTEIQLKDSQGKTHIPDGAVVVRRGAKMWTCLVEVKTGSAALKSDQVNRYLDVAREHSLDAVWTISNDITGSAEESPVAVDRRKLRSVSLVHRSWWRILTEAIVQHRHRGIEDPDQAWILAELIAYLDDERSGASGFQDMGEHWVKVRTGAGEGTLRAGDQEVREVAGRWDQFVEYVCLGLGQDLGRDVRPVRPRKQTPVTRTDAHCKELASSGTLGATIRVPDAAGDIEICADLRAKRVVTAIALEAPGDGRSLTRVNWLLRQLKEASGSLVITTYFVSTTASTAFRLDELREDPKRALLESDSKRTPRSFRISLSGPMGTKRGKGERSFVLETRKQTITFYRDLVQDLQAWRPSAPKLPDEAPESDPVADVIDRPEATAG